MAGAQALDAGGDLMSARQYLQWTDPAAAEALAALAVEDGPQVWQAEALCATADPDAWFPERGDSVQEAKRICGMCPVRAECLEYALKHDDRFGIYGGFSPQERRQLRRAA